MFVRLKCQPPNHVEPLGFGPKPEGVTLQTRTNRPPNPRPIFVRLVKKPRDLRLRLQKDAGRFVFKPNPEAPSVETVATASSFGRKTHIETVVLRVVKVRAIEITVPHEAKVVLGS